MHGDVEAAEARADELRERLQPVAYAPAGGPVLGILAEEGHDPVRTGSTPLAPLHQARGQLRGDGLPLTGRARDAEPQPPAEAAFVTVQRDEHHRVGRMEAHQKGQGIGEFGGAAQGDLLLLVGGTGRFGVLVHGSTLSRNPKSRDPCG